MDLAWREAESSREEIISGVKLPGVHAFGGPASQQMTGAGEDGRMGPIHQCFTTRASSQGAKE